MKRTSLFTLLALVLVLPVSLAFAAGASQPQAANPTIVVPTSLGGVKLNQTEGKARAAWGASRGKCTKTPPSTICEYGDSAGPTGRARIEIFQNKVTAAQIYAGIDADNDQTTSAAPGLMAMKTAEGIGIGSKLAKLRAAYPKGIQEGGKEKEQPIYFTIRGAGKSAMTFTLLGTTKKVFQVVISNGLQG